MGNVEAQRHGTPQLRRQRRAVAEVPRAAQGLRGRVPPWHQVPARVRLKQKGEDHSSQSCRGSPLAAPTNSGSSGTDLYKVLKRKTEATSEARKIVECVEQEDGYEAWRLLGVRYEPQGGMRRMNQLSKLTHLMQKRCKNANETAIILLEVDSHVKKISRDRRSASRRRHPDQRPVGDDGRADQSPCHRQDRHGDGDLSGAEVSVDVYTNLVTSASRSTSASGAVAMDIGSIASVGGSVLPDGTSQDDDASNQQSSTPWTCDEAAGQ